MPEACRVTDIELNPSDGCGCPACTHVVTGPVVKGSPDTFCNNLNVSRADMVDLGVHCCCCGPNIYKPAIGSPDTFVNGHPWSRNGDTNWCCGSGVGPAHMITGSPDTIIN